MKKIVIPILMLFSIWSLHANAQETADAIRIFDEVVFYDGYRLNDNPDKDLDDGILRHSCSLYAVPLTDDVLDVLGEKLDLRVTVRACCDNYDRIGNINLALVEKGASSYIPEETPRIELGRFITPFMDMNVEPNEVPYSYNVDYLSGILRDKNLRKNHDLWLEFELFGVPYAANKEIKGCEGRSDVFAGTLDFVTDEPAGVTEGNILIPIVIKKPEYIGGNLNNYSEQGTDEIGKTVKTYTFELDEDIDDANIVLITSNHGANEGGEEYNRRWHFVYFDDELVLSYLPGRESCEPYRQYNTQSNGIYGFSKKSDDVWQSFSNWCPGDVIDNRILALGSVEKGEHKVRIEVPLAQFVGQQGDIPVSMYFHGKGEINEEEENGVFSLQIDEAVPLRFETEDGILSVVTNEAVWRIDVYSLSGEMIWRQNENSPINLKGRSGMHIVCVELSNGKAYSSKIWL